MIKASLIIERYLYKNEVFKNKSPLNRDNTFDRYIKLKKELKNNFIDISTADINIPEDSQIIIYVNTPKKFIKENNKLYVLFLVENATIWPRNQKKINHELFDIVFTWNDKLVDEKKYYKFNLSYSRENISQNILSSKRTKLVNAIFGKKFKKNTLYKERLRLIKFFDKKKEFDLYGFGWDNFFFNKYPFTYLNRFKFLQKIFISLRLNFKSYKGTIEDKLSTMELYDYSVAFENSSDYEGYITEKIFHPMMAGSIPIYLGASNISKYVPSNCFIDFRDFRSLEDLYEYLKNLSENKKSNFRLNIKKFIFSKQFLQFDSLQNAKKISKIILDTYTKKNETKIF